MKDTPYNIRAKITNSKHDVVVTQGANIKYIPEKLNKFLSSLKKCQASVIPTNKLFDKKKLSPFNGSPFLYLFLQEILGSQKS